MTQRYFEWLSQASPGVQTESGNNHNGVRHLNYRFLVFVDVLLNAHRLTDAALRGLVQHVPSTTLRTGLSARRFFGNLSEG